MELQKFEQLVLKVDQLISQIEDLSRSKNELTAIISEKNLEIDDLKGKFAVLQEERDQVGAKVDDLLERIEMHLTVEP